MSYKLFSYQMSVFRHGMVNPSIPISGIINLKKAMWGVIFNWKFNQKSSKNLYLPNKTFKITFKLNSYLISISRRGPVNPSTSQFSQYFNNWKFTCFLGNLCKISAIICFIFGLSYKSFSYPTSLSHRGRIN